MATTFPWELWPLYYSESWFRQTAICPIPWRDIWLINRSSLASQAGAICVVSWHDVWLANHLVTLFLNKSVCAISKPFFDHDMNNHVLVVYFAPSELIRLWLVREYLLAREMSFALGMALAQHLKIIRIAQRYMNKLYAEVDIGMHDQQEHLRWNIDPRLVGSLAICWSGFGYTALRDMLAKMFGIPVKGQPWTIHRLGEMTRKLFAESFCAALKQAALKQAVSAPSFPLKPSTLVIKNHGLLPEAAFVKFGPRYVHTSLDTCKREIRLLEYTSDIFHSKFRLTNVDIMGHPQFSAVSYAWGNEHNWQSARMANGTIKLHKNIWHFLLRHNEFEQTRGNPSVVRLFRNKNSDFQPAGGRLWIDQICIDQSNTQERNHQVKLMHDIFSAAATVIVWLGEGDQKTYHAFCAMMEIVEDRRRATEAEVRLLTHFFSLPYWSRLWVIQEIMLAKRLEIRCGSSIMDDATFGSFWHWACLTDLNRDIAPRCVSVALSCYRTEGRIQNIQPYRLCDLLPRTYRNECKDFRDKVFGIMALIRAESQIEVDYGKEVDEVFVIVVRQLRREYTFSNDLKYAAVDAGDLILNLAQEMGLDLMNNYWIRRKLQNFLRPLHSGVCAASAGHNDEHQKAWNGGVARLRCLMNLTN